MFGKGLKITSAAFVLVLSAAPAFADAIDGDWCHQASGRHLSIRGPQIVTPGGKRMEGDYGTGSTTWCRRRSRVRARPFSCSCSTRTQCICAWATP